jgi:hypothetical protein
LHGSRDSFPDWENCHGESKFANMIARPRLRRKFSVSLRADVYWRNSLMVSILFP